MFFEALAGEGDFFEDSLYAGNPDKWGWLGVPSGEELSDALDNARLSMWTMTISWL